MYGKMRLPKEGGLTVKKRVFIILLCALLLVSTLSIASSAAANVNYIAINDTLPPELVNTFITYGGAVYVPCWLFNSYSLGVYYSYIEANNTAHIYQNTTQLFFEINSGLTYDGNDNFYSLPGIMRNGTVYVPLSYISAFFGTFSFSIASTQYGSVLRIKDGRMVLSDAEFLQAAIPQLRQYYNAYQTPAKPTPTPTPAVPDIDHEGTELLLSFVGLPGSDYFRLLNSAGVKACFFLTAEEVRSAPDTVRRIACEGHSIGVLCGEEPEKDYEETSSLIFEAARVSTILVNAAEENEEKCREAAEKLSLVYCERGTDAVHIPEDNFSPYVVTSALDASEYGTSLFVSCAEGMEDDTSVILNYLTQNKYVIFAPTEVLN